MSQVILIMIVYQFIVKSRNKFSCLYAPSHYVKADGEGLVISH